MQFFIYVVQNVGHRWQHNQFICKEHTIVKCNTNAYYLHPGETKNFNEKHIFYIQQN